jgi:hypothetical protein
MRNAAHLCPVPGCGNLRLGWATCCRACWRRLPDDYRAAISSAKRDKAPHREAKAAIAATQWLTEHRTAEQTARLLGEREAAGIAPP